MSSLLTALEKRLEPLFDSLPALPKEARRGLVTWWPALALLGAILQFVAAWGLWHAGHYVDRYVDYVNRLSRLYGTGQVVPHLGLAYWLMLMLLIADAVILLLASPQLKQRAKEGWNWLFLGAVINAGYGIIAAFDSVYGGAGHLLGSLLGSAVGFYLLFQVRSYYGTHAAGPSHREGQGGKA